MASILRTASALRTAALGTASIPARTSAAPGVATLAAVALAAVVLAATALAGADAVADVRAAILLLLDEQPRHGYDLIQEITDRSAGAWTPSPGSIYPTLQILEDEGLVTIAQIEGRRTASLTDAGAEYVADNRAQLGTPWDSGSDRSADLAIRKEILALKDAAAQVVRVGSPAQYAAATEVLATARRELYRILAGDDDAPLT